MWKDSGETSDYLDNNNFISPIVIDDIKYKESDIKNLLEELKQLKDTKEFNEKIIKDLVRDLSRYKVDKNAFEAEERMNKKELYEKKKRELILVKNSIIHKKEQHRILTILVKKEMDKVREEIETKKLVDSEEEKANLSKMRNQMNMIYRSQHERKLQDLKSSKDLEIQRLEKQLKKHKKLSKSKDYERYKNKSKSKAPPIFVTRDKKSLKKDAKKKVKRSRQRANKKNKGSDLSLKKIQRSLNKYFTV